MRSVFVFLPAGVRLHLPPRPIFSRIRLHAFVATALVIGTSGAVAVVPSTTLTFDDLPAVSEDALIPDGYGGLNWDNMYYLNGPSFHPGSGYDNGRVSGDYVAYNGFANAAAVSDTEFDLNSAYFTGAWNNGLNLTVKGFNDGIESYSTSFVVNYDAPTLVNLDFLSVDRVTFDSFGGVDADPTDGWSGSQFAMDNLTITLIPEPSTFALLGVGSLAWLIVRRRRLSHGSKPSSERI